MTSLIDCMSKIKCKMSSLWSKHHGLKNLVLTRLKQLYFVSDVCFCQLLRVHGVPCLTGLLHISRYHSSDPHMCCHYCVMKIKCTRVFIGNANPNGQNIVAYTIYSWLTLLGAIFRKWCVFQSVTKNLWRPMFDWTSTYLVLPFLLSPHVFLPLILL